jgi:hypothetical protein
MQGLIQAMNPYVIATCEIHRNKVEVILSVIS